MAGGSFDQLAFQSDAFDQTVFGSVTADAHIHTVGGADALFVVDADILVGVRVRPSFTANAVVRRPDQTGSFTADATFVRPNARVTQIAVEVLEQSSVLNARVTQVAVEVLDVPSVRNARVTQIAVEVLRSNRIVTETFTADARFTPKGLGSFTADAVRRRVHVNAFLADAAIGYKAFRIDAVLKGSLAKTFSANAVLVNFSATFTANAYIAHRFHANAVISKAAIVKTFTANAIYGRFFKANAAIRGSTSKSFTIDARFLRHSFTASAVIAPIAAGQPGGPPAGTVLPLSIKVSGLDITADVEIATAKFTQAVNARPGEFSFEVKDDEHIYQFVSGGRVTCDINGHRLFDGYVTRATMHYAFPVDIVSDPATTPRLWKLEGPDLNILFQKRYIYDQVNPNADLPTFAENTSDKTIIMTYINEYLDLRGDEITTDGVTAVGTSNPDGPYVDQRGSTWGIAMGQIAQLPGAVWGLTQDRDLFYEDANVENAPFRLSDTPNGTTTIGYSTFNWTDDGTKLVNDAQVWGAGTGSTVKVYSEVKDATSIAEHNRWQLPGQYRSDMFRQATVDHVAHSIVYGSEQNLHGGKDPYILVNCRIKQHGLRAGMKVRIFNSVYGMDQVLPIRRMTMTFVNASDVLYDLELTREIDQPWFFAEFAGYPKLPPFHGPKFCPPGFVRVGAKCVPIKVDPPLPGCSSEVCGVTDSFDRVPNQFDWGRSDVGADWKTPATGYGIAKTDGGRGVLKAVKGQPVSAELVGANITAPIDVRFEFTISAINNLPLDWLTFDIGGARLRIDYGSDNHVFEGAGTELWIGEASTGNAQAIKHSYTAGVIYHVHLTFVPGGDFASNGLITASVWPAGTPEPALPDLSMVSIHGLQAINPTFEVLSSVPPPATEPYGPGSVNSADGPTITIDTFDILGLNRCNNVQFDNFERTVSNGWGTATPSGVPWVVVADASDFAVDGFRGGLTFTSGSPAIKASAIPAMAGGVWTMTARYLISAAETWTVHYKFDGPNGQIDVYTTFSGTIELGSGSASASYGVVWSTLVVSWNGTTGDVKVKTWPDGSADPGWQIEDNWGVDTSPLENLTIQGMFASGTSRTVLFDSIDFDYAGKPCYISCPEIDYTVYPLDWVQTPGVYCAVVPGLSYNQRNCYSNGSPDPLSAVYLYGGATYEVKYQVVHSYDSMNLVPSLYSPQTSSFAGVSMGAAADCWLWPVPNTNPDTMPIGEAKVIATQFTDAWMYANLGSSMCCCGTNYGSSMTAWVKYVSGPDPRFEGLAAQPCVPISSATGQPAPSAGASGTQTGARINSTTYEVWVPFVPGTATVWLNGRLMRLTYDYTEDPAGARIYFVLPIDINDVVYITYIAAGPATTSSWLPGSV